MKRDRLAEVLVGPRKKAPFIVTRRRFRRQQVFSMLRSVVIRIDSLLSGICISGPVTFASFGTNALSAANAESKSRMPSILLLIPDSLAQQMAVLLVSSFAAAEPRNQAGVAQLVEQLICNHQVGGSSPFAGSR